MEVSGQFQACVALPVVEPPVPVELEAGWGVQPVWSVGEDNSSLTPGGNRTTIPRTSNP